MGEDSFSVLPSALTTLKPYAPMTADLLELNRFSYMDDEGEPLDGHGLLGYADQSWQRWCGNRCRRRRNGTLCTGMERTMP